jgi:hypothetical protein
MKNLIPRIFLSGVVAVALAGVNAPQNSSAQTEPAPATAGVAPVAPPPDIPAGTPLAEVVRLTQAGVDQGIIMNYVTGSTGTFNLDSDRIIYLTDLGAPSTLITAMMQRDRELQQQFTATPTGQPAPTETQPAPPATTEAAPQPEAQPAPVTVNYFYDTLTPYGSWVVVNGYGRCWRPAACTYNPSWQPYCDNGQWVYTDCGWYWNSSYAWGATFHYGRWFRDANVGWCWSPDTVWAPSWVTWRYSDNYCGWAPLPPGTACQAGVGIVYHGSGVSVGFGFGLAANCFTFVSVQHFCDPHPRNYCVAPAQVTQVYNQTKVINNIKVKGNGNTVIVNNGIAVQNVAAAAHTPIRQVPVHTIDRSFTQNPAHFRSSAPVAGQPPHSTIINENGNNHPAQNNFHQTAVNQNPPPHQTETAPQTSSSQFSRAHAAAGGNNPATTIPQNPAPAANHHSSALPSNYYPQPATARWPQLETPRNYGRNAEARQNSPAPTTAPAPHSQNFNQSSRNDPRANYFMPAAMPSSPSGGGHNGGNGNQTWGFR